VPLCLTPGLPQHHLTRRHSCSVRVHGQAAISVWRYVTTSQFWFESMQNWQSEFIAVAAIVGLSILLRRGALQNPSQWPSRTDIPAPEDMTLG